MPIGGSWYLGLPGALSLTSPLRLDPVPILNSDQSADSIDDLETPFARARLQPTLFFIPADRSVLIKVSTDLETEWITGGEVDPRLRSDPSIRRGARFRLAQAYTAMASKRWTLLLGLLRPTRGLGLVSNPGVTAPYHQVRESPYGSKDLGDQLIRLQTVSMPWGVTPTKESPLAARHRGSETIIPLAISVFGDAVFLDERASWERGDRAYQSGGGVGHLGEVFSVSIGGAYRRQRHHEGGLTRAASGLVSAGAFHVITAGSHDLGLWLETEVSWLKGESTYSQSVTDASPLSISGLAGLARAGLSHDKGQFVVEVGYASGDNNPFDRDSNTFRMDRAYRVGSLLFPYVLRATSAASAANIADPNYRFEAPRGHELLSTGGALENVLYVNPRGLFQPADWVSFNVGYLQAQSDAPFLDPYQAGLIGGGAVGPLGGDPSSDLGQEISVGFDLTHRMNRVDLALRSWASLFLPGAVFDTADGDSSESVTGAWSAMEVRW